MLAACQRRFCVRAFWLKGRFTILTCLFAVNPTPRPRCLPFYGGQGIAAKYGSYSARLAPHRRKLSVICQFQHTGVLLAMLAFVLGGVLVGIFIFAWLLPKINGMMLLKRHREARRRRFDDLCGRLCPQRNRLRELKR